MSPAPSQPSLQHNGSTTDVTNISLSLPSVPDADQRTDAATKLSAAAFLPKKPLTPYMKFSKSVSVCVCCKLVCVHACALIWIYNTGTVMLCVA